VHYNVHNGFAAQILLEFLTELKLFLTETSGGLHFILVACFIRSHLQFCPKVCLATTTVVNVKKKVKLSLCLTKHYTMKTYGGVDV
jgi:hypothetical protein